MRLFKKAPSKKYQLYRLAKQKNRCFYCRQELFELVILGKKIIQLKLHWDHFIPYVYCQHNRDENFIAACHVCNLWKHDLYFESIYEARMYLLKKWLKKSVHPFFINRFSVKINKLNRKQSERQNVHNPLGPQGQRREGLRLLQNSPTNDDLLIKRLKQIQRWANWNGRNEIYYKKA